MTDSAAPQFNSSSTGEERTALHARAIGKEDALEAIEAATYGDTVERDNVIRLPGDLGEIVGFDAVAGPAVRLASGRPKDKRSAFENFARARWFSHDDELFEIYWEAVELETRRANVRIIRTFHDAYGNDRYRSLYVVDLDQFPRALPVPLTVEDGEYLIEESAVQRAFGPARQRLTLKERITGRLSTPATTADLEK